MNQPTLPMPDSSDWLDTAQAMAILDVKRSTLWRMVQDKIVTQHRVGSIGLYWRPEIIEVAAARKRMKRPRA